MEKISAVLIVKNEETVLGRCLESLHGADQIVVLDTGSSDGTMKVAGANGAEVHTTEPIRPFHFGEARNRALVHAKYDWCLSIDADEIAGKGSIRTLKRALAARPQAHGIVMKYIMRGEGSDKAYPTVKMRIFRKSAFEWKYRVHEMLVPKIKGAMVLELPEVSLEHLPIVDKSVRHGQNLDLLRLSVEESPEHTRNVRQLALELMLLKRWDEAIGHMKRWLEKMPVFDPIERSEALIYIGQCHLGASGMDERCKELETELSKDPSRLDELIATFYQRVDMERIDEAVKWFAMAAQEAPGRREPYFFAGDTLFRAAKIEEAIPWLEKASGIPRARKPDYCLNLNFIWDGEPERLLSRAKQLVAAARRA